MVLIVALVCTSPTISEVSFQMFIRSLSSLTCKMLAPVLHPFLFLSFVFSLSGCVLSILYIVCHRYYCGPLDVVILDYFHPFLVSVTCECQLSPLFPS